MRKAIAFVVLLGLLGCTGGSSAPATQPTGTTGPAASGTAATPAGSAAPVLKPGPNVPVPGGAEDLAATRELEAIRGQYAEAQRKFAEFSKEGTNKALWTEARTAVDGVSARIDTFVEAHPDHQAGNDLAVEVNALRSAIMQANPD